MSRPSLFVLAASLAAVAVGCAHCDTCDDFPAPCTGPNCGYQYHASFPFEDGMHVEPIHDGPAGMGAGPVIHGPMGGAPAGAAPSVVPPSPTPASPSSGGGASGRRDGSGSGSDPLDIPLPSTDSPFGGPVPD